MEIFIHNLPFEMSRFELTRILAPVFHGPEFSHLGVHGAPINFDVWFPPSELMGEENNGKGFLTVPSKEIGEFFLLLYSDPDNNVPPGLEEYRIYFKPSTRNPHGKRSVVRNLLSTPYTDPATREAQQRRKRFLEDVSVPFATLQFLYKCRDGSYSIEWEKTFDELDKVCSIDFQADHRQLVLSMTPNPLGSDSDEDFKYSVTISFSHVDEVAPDDRDAIFLSLSVPPRYGRIWDESQGDKEERLSFLPFDDHERVAPFASHAIRLVCRRRSHVHTFRGQCEVAGLPIKQTPERDTLVRGNFLDPTKLATLDQWLRSLDFLAAFQILALVRNLVVDPREALSLKPVVQRWIAKKCPQYVATVLQKLQDSLRTRDDPAQNPGSGLAALFEAALHEHDEQGSLALEKAQDPNVCYVHHVIVTPTTMVLGGPSAERSNRVIRQFASHHHLHFIRVSFLDEGEEKYRYSRGVDGEGFIKARVGRTLLEGLDLCGRRYDFLAWSLSALKEHCVWFVNPFQDEKKGPITASKIIETIGTFDNLPFDRKLRLCPARYAARIAQAFTATDVSISVTAEEVFIQPDISTPDKKYHFTDGVGSISSDLAEDIRFALRGSQRKATPKSSRPAAFQIRFMGSKGMLSIDHKLKGRAVVLRESMVKFHAPGAQELEIARSFDRPGTYYLNRPLVMLLDGLGVPFEAFKKYQDLTIQQTRRAAWSLKNAAGLMEQHSLGTSFRLSSVLFNLERIHISLLPGDLFYTRVVQCVVNHILRQLKYGARIPIPGGWTLPGVADVHEYLKPKEIFACVKPPKGGAIYLEGPVLISRSPTIHPGDVMVVHAIGAPPPGSPFEIQPLRNTVVFSVLGDRPVPSCLGGGDLDGDVYNLIPLRDMPEFTPKIQHSPANYEAGEKVYLDHPSTKEDIVNFFTEFIISDVLGMVAHRWLIIADQTQHASGSSDPDSGRGIFAEDCLTLAQLHSDAVDYSKTGRPVPVSTIPQTDYKSPDWNKPETMDKLSGNYYENPPKSTQKRKRDDLSDDESGGGGSSKKQKGGQRGDSTDRLIDQMEEDEEGADDDDDKELEPETDTGLSPIEIAVRNKVREYTSTREQPSQEELSFIEQLYAYHRAEMRSICVSHTLSAHRPGSMLTEEEVVAGTISHKTSNPRKRKDLMAKMNEKSALLVKKVRSMLAGGDEVTSRESLRRAYIGWKFAKLKGDELGAWSFWVVCLLAIFEAVKELDDRGRDEESAWH